MTFRLITQATFIIAALVILITFVQPTFEKIKNTQDEIFKYKNTVEKATQFNARLQELVNIRNTFSDTDLQRLENFIPTEIDSVQVMRQIEGIFETRQIQLFSLTAKELINPRDEDAVFEQVIVEENRGIEIPYQDFEVKFKGDYRQLRDILALAEANDTLLEVVTLDFDTVTNVVPQDEETSQIDNAIEFLIVFRTYAMNAL